MSKDIFVASSLHVCNVLANISGKAFEAIRAHMSFISWLAGISLKHSNSHIIIERLANAVSKGFLFLVLDVGIGKLDQSFEERISCTWFSCDICHPYERIIGLWGSWFGNVSSYKVIVSKDESTIDEISSLRSERLELIRGKVSRLEIRLCLVDLEAVNGKIRWIKRFGEVI